MTRGSRRARRRRGCWSCRDRCRRLYPSLWLQASGFWLRARAQPKSRAKTGGLSFDGRQQVVDVVAFEQPSRAAPRASRGARPATQSPLSRPTARSAPRAAARAPRACARSARVPHRAATRAPPDRRRTPALANLVELLVQREHFLEQRRRHLRRCPIPSDFADGKPFDRQQVLDARRRHCAARDTRRSDTTTARGWRAARPATRCSSSRGETCGSARGSGARGRPARSVSLRGRPRNAK